jgi:hypothetical protein
MVDRFLVWLGTGIVTAGLSAAMLAGAGVAIATDGTSSEGGGASASSNSADSKGDSGSTSQPSKSDAAKADSDVEADTKANDDATTQPDVDTDPEDTDTDDATDPDLDEEPAEVEITDDADEVASDDETTSSRSDSLATVDTEPATAKQTPAADEQTEEPDVSEAASVAGDPAPTPAAESVEYAALVTFDTDWEPAADRVVMTALEVDEPAPAPTLINVVGSLFFGLFDMFAKMFAGPPSVPANYNVRVARSALEIDCGDGYTTEADWYIPTSQEPPHGLIYLQHGFATQPGFYKVTAAKLAESTNSIVVVPSITSNVFACDACHLTGDPMHFAVAKLFSGDRAALNASLNAAFEGEDITLPQKYVLVGHSGGSSMAAGVGGFASQLGGPSGDSDMAGVILFDTNDIGEFVSRGISKVPLATPVYYVGAESHIINNFDEVSGVMKELRPNQFTGVHIDGGVHADILEGLNPLGEFVLNLALGTPRPENTAAANLLAVGWINDMFSAGPDTGIYPGPGASVDVETDEGTAHIVGLGGPIHELSFIESLISLFYGQINNLRFGYCAADVDVLLAAELTTSTASASSACLGAKA